MKKFTLLLKTTLIAVFAIYASVNLNAGTITIVPDQTTTGMTGTGYVATLTNFTAEGIEWAINNWIPNTIQVRGNNSTVSSNFQFYNTTAIPGHITKVTLNAFNTDIGGTGTNRLNPASISLVAGTGVQSGTSTGIASTAGTGCVYWDLSGENDFFRIQFVNGATGGTARISSIEIEYSESTNPVVATPAFSVPTGTYTVPQNVTITTATDGASIYYTTDGNDPTESSTPYTTPITVSANTTIKAIAIKEGMDNSSIASATYTFLVEDPTFFPVLGFYTAPQNVTISTTTDGASIYYTIDGSDPTAGSTLYIEPITVSTTTTIKAIAIKAGMNNSGIVAATYTLPEISGDEEIYYKTGFEASEGFTAGTNYSNTSMAFSGPANAQWGTIFGTPTTTNFITGAQSMQMRWYSSGVNANICGSAETRFDLPNVTKVTFKAKNTVVTNGMDVTVLYSTDEGVSWTGDEVFTLGTTAANFTYNISATGEFANVRIKFLVTQSGAAPTGTVQVTIDDVAVYVMPALVIGPGETKYVSDYKGGDIIIQSSEDPHTGVISTGQLDLQGLPLTVTGVVKFEQAFTAGKWYAVGFPFDVASVSCDGVNLETYDYLGTGGSKGNYWLKTYNGEDNKFYYYNDSLGSTTIDAGGYILQVPTGISEKTITFTSVSPITLTGTATFAIKTNDYLLTNNPWLTNNDVTNGVDANSYYTYESKYANNFGLSASTYTLRPFESLVIANNIAPDNLRSDLGTGEVTGLPPALNLPNDKPVTTEYYNLMGVKVAQPAGGNIYVVKTVFESGKTSVIKQIIDKY